MGNEISDILEEAPSNRGNCGDHCAADGKNDFRYVGAPLKIVCATGSPINPIAIKQPQ